MHHAQLDCSMRASSFTALHRRKRRASPPCTGVLYFISAQIQTQPTPTGNGTNQAASKAQVTRPFLFMIGSAMIANIQKHDKHHKSALLTLSDRSQQVVASAASGPKVKQSIGTAAEAGQCLG